MENTRSLITAEQVRTWCGSPDTVVVVRPVIDLNDHVHVTAYEVPDRMAEAAVPADVTCVFPCCTRPGAGLPGRGARRRLRPHHRPPLRRPDLFGQCRAAVPAPPPVEDSWRVALRAGRARELPVDLAARTVVPA